MKITLTTGLLSLSLLAGGMAACGGGGSSAPAATSDAPAVSVTSSVFALTSSVGAAGGLLPADYTCDGTSSSPPLAWANAPSGTKEFALLMTTVPTTGSIKYNWVLSGIPATAASLARNSTGVGTAGVGSDGPTAAYQAPCSQGPGAKEYIFTLYALSASPALSVAANAVSGGDLANAIAPVTLAATSLTLNYTRGATVPPTPAVGTAAANCLLVGDSLLASTSGVAASTCDATYAYIASNGLPTHAMAARGIVRTFQHNKPFASMSVRENVMMGLHTRLSGSLWQVLAGTGRAARAEREAAQRAEELIDFVGLGEWRNADVNTLSFGQGRLLEIARGLAAEPRLMLFDEPAAGLTPAECGRVSEIILEISRRGIAVLLIEHDMRFLMALAHRVIVLNFGRKIAEGTPAEVQANAAVVAAYLGDVGGAAHA